MEDAPLLVSIREARDKLGGIGHTTVYELVKRGLLTKVNIGRRGFITARSLTDYVNALSEAANQSDPPTSKTRYCETAAP